MIVSNLARSVQPVDLDLSPYKGSALGEMIDETAFPAIGDGPYPLTLGPHASYWFALQTNDGNA